MSISCTHKPCAQLTLEGIPLDEIAATQLEDGGSTALRLSRTDILDHFALSDPELFTQEHFERLQRKVEQRSAPGDAYFLSDALPAAQRTRPTIHAGILSEHTRCIAQAVGKATTEPQLRLEIEQRALRNAEQSQDSGRYVFHRYIHRRLLGKQDANRHFRGKHHEQRDVEGPLALLELIADDSDLLRRDVVARYVQGQGCADVRPVADCAAEHSSWWNVGTLALKCPELVADDAVPCFSRVLEATSYDYPIVPVYDGETAEHSKDGEALDAHAKINTYSASARTLRAMRPLSDPKKPLPFVPTRVLIIGAGWEVVPDTYPAPTPSQINEHVAVMNVLVGAGVALSDLHVDVVDINPIVVQHIKGAKASGMPYPLHLYWSSYEGGESIPIAQHLPQAERPERLLFREEGDFICGGGMCGEYTLTEIKERIVLDPIIWNGVHARVGDVTVDRLRAHGPYDLAVMLNVHYYLNEVEQSHAIDNIVDALVPGGLLLTDKATVLHRDCHETAMAPIEAFNYSWRGATLYQKGTKN